MVESVTLKDTLKSSLSEDPSRLFSGVYIDMMLARSPCDRSAEYKVLGINALGTIMSIRYFESRRVAGVSVSCHVDDPLVRFRGNKV